MKQWTWEAKTQEDTKRLGAVLAQLLPNGAVVALMGPLGAGKTRLVQALAQAEGVPADLATSPTFVLIHEYGGRRPIYHMDAYRIRSEQEFMDLGPEEYWEGSGICLIEWADRVAGCLPPERLEIHIEITGPTSRRFTCRAFGPAYENLVAELPNVLVGLEKMS
ncbi:MAG: tRNA (adenosine(37)-N6)-threonylcarbamoyltransferase complex ATPase subunit type 1 TsaE [Thermoguttaceae bacterium]|nr:tRNA (adenosine(37)-N6)-threonylcarbamoyltransferase complex ATPase subunit type 1 TsaE [Thermoguttaceae bacterium]MDW8038755.1 tRNA (adenosine(37)-N6)-threonylcarbamoyltransferase complex ATPase subunit type 1 TsaE [Thermoguttaceae bacterium]